MEYLRQLDPVALALGGILLLLAAIVLAINRLGRRFAKHDTLIYLLDVKVGNIHKDREATRVRRLQHPAPRDIVPPPLPPRAPTIDATDWRDDDQQTEQLLLKTTARYPRGKPPEGDE